MITDDSNATAIKFDVAPDHDAWLETVRQSVAPADLDLFELCAAQGFHLHPPSVLVHMGEVLEYNPGEIRHKARWMRGMTLVEGRGTHPSTTAFAEFANRVDSHMTGLAPPHEYGAYVEVVDREDGATWPCSSFSFLDALYWATGTDQITAITFTHDRSKPFPEVTVTVAGVPNVVELHVATDTLRDALARHHYEHVDEAPDDVIVHLNALTDARCRTLLAGTYTYPHHDLWDLEKALAGS